MVGADDGLLKLLFDPQSLKVLGVHVIGESAAEIVHIGQAVMALNGTMEYFRDTVFNYPTFAEAYKVAALNGLNKLGLTIDDVARASMATRICGFPPVHPPSSRFGPWRILDRSDQNGAWKRMSGRYTQLPNSDRGPLDEAAIPIPPPSFSWPCSGRAVRLHLPPRRRPPR